MNYQQMWDEMIIKESFIPQIKNAVNKILPHSGRYEEVANIVGCPWYFIGLTHYRESGVDFRGVLHNGEKIIGTDKKTSLVPKGRGPFDTWEESAIDALKLRNIDKIKHWDVAVLLQELEEYNGLGYKKYHPDIPTPYLWSGTTFYTAGKYAADGKFDKNLVDKQLGCAPILKYLI